MAPRYPSCLIACPKFVWTMPTRGSSERCMTVGWRSLERENLRAMTLRIGRSSSPAASGWCSMPAHRYARWTMGRRSIYCNVDSPQRFRSFQDRVRPGELRLAKAEAEGPPPSLWQLDLLDRLAGQVRQRARLAGAVIGADGEVVRSRAQSGEHVTREAGVRQLHGLAQGRGARPVVDQVAREVGDRGAV